MQIDESKIIIANKDGTYTFIDKNTNDKVIFSSEG